MNRAIAVAVGLGLLLGVSACGTSAPSASKNMGRIATYKAGRAAGDTLGMGGPARASQYEAIVIKIEDEAGNVVFDERNRKMFSFHTDLSSGNYKITHTCSSTLLKWEDYRRAQPHWPNVIEMTRLNLKSGELWELKVMSGVNLKNDIRRRRGASQYGGYKCSGRYQRKK